MYSKNAPKNLKPGCYREVAVVEVTIHGDYFVVNKRNQGEDTSN